MLVYKFAAALSVCLLTISAQAQVVSVRTLEATPELTTEQREAAGRLLDEVVDDSDTLRAAENRSLIRATAAGLLWTRDEERARTLFRQAVADLAAITLDARVPSYQRSNDAQLARGLRYQVMNLIAERDARLAVELLRESRRTLEWVTQTEPYQQDDEVRLEMSFAHRAAADDPALALEIAEANLEKGLTTEITSVLWQMQEGHPTEAARLARRITERLREPGATTDRQAFYAAANLLQNAARQASPGNQNFPAQAQQGAVAPPRPTPLFDTRALGEIADFVAARMLDGTTPGYDLQQFMTTLAPSIERYAPARSAALQRRNVEVRRNVDPQARAYTD